MTTPRWRASSRIYKIHETASCCDLTALGFIRKYYFYFSNVDQYFQPIQAGHFEDI